MQAHEAQHARKMLERATLRHPRHADLWFALALAARDEEKIGLALLAAERAAECAPDHPKFLVASAQLRFDCGLSSVEHFRRAASATHQDPTVVRGLALALEAEGRLDEAESLLSAQLAARPDWIDGHRALTTLRWTRGQKSAFDESFSLAAQARPANVAVWRAWFEAVVHARQWERARDILDMAQAQTRQSAPFLSCRYFLAGERGSPGDLERLPAIDPAGFATDPVPAISQVRYHLRLGDPARALPVAIALLSTRYANMAWPYLSTIWRLLGDSRLDWFEQSDRFIRAYELGLSADTLADLAALLRRLHRPRDPHLDQSVRGGTQTDGHLFYRQDSQIQLLRHRILSALEDYAESLPKRDADHPLLGPRRDRLAFSGSWSVRLGPGGRNVAHTHPKGWISGAFYVNVPPLAERGAAPAGHIEFGVPPAELGLNLAPIARIEPAPGRVALFPSTMWHGTVPFDQGERLVVAFDLRIPHS